MNLSEAIEVLDKKTPYPSKGLCDEVFLFISRMTPLVSVDLLIKDEFGRTLLAWRDDQYYGKGWHLPGGIVRFKETMEARIRKVAEKEIGYNVQFKKTPIMFKEFINPVRNNRGHFLVFLYDCFASSIFVPQNKGLSVNDAGYLLWHDSCPENLIEVQKIYRKYIGVKA